MHRPRLETAGLWDVVDDADKERNPPITSWTLKGSQELNDGPERVRRAFGKEKVYITAWTNSLICL